MEAIRWASLALPLAGCGVWADIRDQQAIAPNPSQPIITCLIGPPLQQRQLGGQAESSMFCARPLAASSPSARSRAGNSDELRNLAQITTALNADSPPLS